MSRGKQHTVATGVVEMCNGVNSIVVAVGESDWESDESPVFPLVSASLADCPRGSKFWKAVEWLTHKTAEGLPCDCIVTGFKVVCITKDKIAQGSLAICLFCRI